MPKANVASKAFELNDNTYKKCRDKFYIHFGTRVHTGSVGA